MLDRIATIRASLVARIPERRAYLAVCVLLGCVYLVQGVLTQVDVDPYRRLGFSQYKHLSPIGLVTLAASLVIAASWSRFRSVAVAVAWLKVRVDERPFLFSFGLSLAAIAVFYALRNEFINPDGQAFSSRWPDIFARRGIIASHDEILEFLLHSKVWLWTRDAWGWDINHVYHVTSSLAGGVFVFGLFWLARTMIARGRALFVLLVFSGAWVQLFFGDVENYTYVNLVLFLHAFAGLAYLSGRVGLWLPSMLFALAVCFHLLAAWLGLSLVYLFWLEYRARGPRGVVLSAASMLLVIVVVVLYAQLGGLHFSRFYRSHAVQAVRRSSQYFSSMSPKYLVATTSLWILLCPGLLLLPLLALFGRIRRSPSNCFLGILFLGSVLFGVFWRAQIGILNDWNLFAVIGLAGSLFVWKIYVEEQDVAALRPSTGLFLVLSSYHSYAWIVYNHGGGP